MPFDFPGAPNPGDVFTDPSGASFTWNGYAWMGGAANSMGALIISPTPPPAPTDNSLWWESDTGMLFLRYNDGNSSQWVQVNALPNGAGYMPLLGVTDGSNALPGQIGEVISSVVTSAVSMPASTNTLVASIVLTPGDWDVSAELFVTPTAATSTIWAGINNAPTMPASPSISSSRVNIALTTAGITASQIQLVPKTCRSSSASSVTMYAVCSSPGAGTAIGAIWARRAR